jgi:hypothetical protein
VAAGPSPQAPPPSQPYPTTYPAPPTGPQGGYYAQGYAYPPQGYPAYGPGAYHAPRRITLDEVGLWLNLAGGVLFGLGLVLFASFWAQFPPSAGSTPNYGGMEAGYVLLGVGIMLLALGIAFIQKVRMDRRREAETPAASPSAMPGYLPPTA